MKKYTRILIIVLALVMMISAVASRIVLSVYGSTWSNGIKILIAFGWIFVFVAALFVFRFSRFICPKCGTKLNLIDGSNLGEIREVTHRVEVSKYVAIRTSSGGQQILERLWRCPKCQHETIMRIKERRKASSKSIDF